MAIPAIAPVDIPDDGVEIGDVWLEVMAGSSLVPVFVFVAAVVLVPETAEVVVVIEVCVDDVEEVEAVGDDDVEPVTKRPCEACGQGTVTPFRCSCPKVPVPVTAGLTGTVSYNGVVIGVMEVINAEPEMEIDERVPGQPVVFPSLYNTPNARLGSGPFLPHKVVTETE